LFFDYYFLLNKISFAKDGSPAPGLLRKSAPDDAAGVRQALGKMQETR